MEIRMKDIVLILFLNIVPSSVKLMLMILNLLLLCQYATGIFMTKKNAV